MTSATWNPGDLVNTTLTDNNLTARNVVNVAGGVRSTSGQTTGKYYFEFTINVNGGRNSLGVANVGANLATVYSDRLGAVVLYPYQNNLWINGVFVGVPFQAVPWSTFLYGISGVTIGVALDLDTRNIWFRFCTPLNGIWNNSSTANPTIEVGGFDISSIVGSAIFPFCANDTTNTDETVTANFGALPFLTPAPPGFSAGFPGGPPSVTQTWNPASALGATVLAGNTVAVFGHSASGIEGARTSASGLVTYDLQFSGSLSPLNMIGIGNASVDLSTVATTAANAAVVYVGLGLKFGQIWINGVFTSVVLPTINHGSVLSIALDATHNLIWFKDLSFGGTWNDSGSADPATGIGGFDISGIATSPFVFLAATDGSFPGSGDSAVIISGTGPPPPSPPPPPQPGPKIAYPLRERTYHRRFLGLGFDPTIVIVKDRPGPIRIIEFDAWMN